MPCNSEYLEPNLREAESKRVAQILVYLSKCLGEEVSPEIKEAAKALYGNADKVDDFTAELCKKIRSLTEDQLDSFVYNGRNRRSLASRQLMDWWEDHQDWDRRRRKEARAKKKQETLQKSALAKLTPEERKALGY